MAVLADHAECRYGEKSKRFGDLKNSPHKIFETVKYGLKSGRDLQSHHSLQIRIVQNIEIL